MKPILNGYGYLTVNLYDGKNSKCICIYKLVARCFIPNPFNKREVDHKYGMRLDNFVDNLRWATHAENIQFAFALGLSPMGHNRSDAKLTEEQCVIIREKSVGISVVELAKRFGVTSSAISQIQRGLKYKNAKGRIRDKIDSRIPDGIREKICSEYRRGVYGCGVPSLARKYGLGRTTVQRIVNGH